MVNGTSLIAHVNVGSHPEDSPTQVFYEPATGWLLATENNATTGFLGELSPSDPLVTGYVAVHTDINQIGGTPMSDPVEFLDGVANISLEALGSDPSWTNYSNGWVNPMGNCSVQVGVVLEVNGVPNACSDPPAGPFQSQLIGWPVYAGISVDISQGAQNIPDTGEWRTQGVEVVDTLFTQTVLFAAVESPPPY